MLDGLEIKQMTDHTIELTLDDTEWAEIYYAIEGKYHRLEDGYYGDPKDPEVVRWMGQMEEIRDKLEDEFDKHGVNY